METNNDHITSEDLDSAIDALEQLEKDANNGDNDNADTDGKEAISKAGGNPEVKAMQATIDELAARLDKQAEQMGRMVTLFGARFSAPETGQAQPTDVDESDTLPTLAGENAHKDVPDISEIKVDFH